MFNPAEREKAKSALKEKKAQTNRVSELAAQLIPVDIQEGLLIDVKEVQCGDPNCAPVDTVFTLVWRSGGRGMFALPLPVNEVDRDVLVEMFPDEETLRKWFAKEEAHWPRRPELRFPIGTRVECRIGAHPIKGWAPGLVIAHFYSEPSWPANMFAPYQIRLDDGRLIFAPQDVNEVIRAEGSAPALPEGMTAADFDHMAEGEGEEEDGEGEYDDEDEGEYEDDNEEAA